MTDAAKQQLLRQMMHGMRPHADRRENSRHESRHAADTPRPTLIRHATIKQDFGCGLYEVTLTWRNFEDPEAGTGTGTGDCDPCDEDCGCDFNPSGPSRDVFAADIQYERELEVGSLVIVARIPTGNAVGNERPVGTGGTGTGPDGGGTGSGETAGQGNPPFRWWIIEPGGPAVELSIVTDVICTDDGGTGGTGGDCDKFSACKTKVMLPVGTRVCPTTTEELGETCGGGTGGTGGGTGGGGGGAVVPCCDGVEIPTTLTLSFEDAGGCATLDGITVPLVYDSDPVNYPNLHVGTFTAPSICGGGTVTVIFKCCPVTGDCTAFNINMVSGSACFDTGEVDTCGAAGPNGGNLDPATCSCDPVYGEMTWSPSACISLPGCCDLTPPGNLKIVLSE